MSNNKTPNKPKTGGFGRGGPHAVGITEKPKNFWNAIGRLAQKLKNYRVAVIISLISSALSSVFDIIGPALFGLVTSSLFGSVVDGTPVDFPFIGKILLTSIGLYVVSTLFSYTTALLTSWMSQDITYNLRRDISEKIHRMPFSRFDSENHGEVLSIVTNDIETLGQTLNQSLPQLVSSLTAVVGIFIMMFAINVHMALISIILLPLSMVMISLLVKFSQKFFKQQQEFLGHVDGQVEEVFGAQNIVRAFNAEQREFDTFDEDNEKLRQASWKAQFLSSLMMPITVFFTNLTYAANVVTGGYLVLKGIIQVGVIQTFAAYSNRISQPLSMIAQSFGTLQGAAAAAERVFDFLEEEEEDNDGGSIVDIEQMSGRVTFEHVRFGYNPDKVIINDFSAKIKSGQKIAIVGPTGAGKTTLIKLLMRFYDVNGGRILVDGHDVRDFPRTEIRQAFGMVLQDAWLFSGTIRDNIRYGRLGAEDYEITEAAKGAYVHHFIQTLPDGYDMMLSEDADNVSGGQKQLLTIARAMLADPKILILDEATSSVDTRTEERIQKAMDNLMKGRTSFIIAHRLSTIQNADLILVMRDGDIVEQGSHTELLGQDGFYASLYNSQFSN